MPRDLSPAERFDRLLVSVGRNRDRESFIELFEYFAPRVKSFLMKAGLSESHADELAQETMLAIWHKAESFDPAQASAATWIYTIARNKRIDSLRKMNRIEVDFEDPLFVPDDQPSPQERIAGKEEHDRLADVLSSLPEDQASLLRKSFYEDKSHSEIAAETRLPLGTVKSRIRAALGKLREQKEVKALWP